MDSLPLDLKLENLSLQEFEALRDTLSPEQHVLLDAFIAQIKTNKAKLDANKNSLSFFEKNSASAKFNALLAELSKTMAPQDIEDLKDTYQFGFAEQGLARTLNRVPAAPEVIAAEQIAADTAPAAAAISGQDYSRFRSVTYPFGEYNGNSNGAVEAVTTFKGVQPRVTVAEKIIENLETLAIDVFGSEESPKAAYSEKQIVAAFDDFIIQVESNAEAKKAGALSTQNLDEARTRLNALIKSFPATVNGEAALPIQYALYKNYSALVNEGLAGELYIDVNLEAMASKIASPAFEAPVADAAEIIEGLQIFRDILAPNVAEQPLAYGKGLIPSYDALLKQLKYNASAKDAGTLTASDVANTRINFEDLQASIPDTVNDAQMTELKERLEISYNALVAAGVAAQSPTPESIAADAVAAFEAQIAKNKQSIDSKKSLSSDAKVLAFQLFNTALDALKNLDTTRAENIYALVQTYKSVEAEGLLKNPFPTERPEISMPAPAPKPAPEAPALIYAPVGTIKATPAVAEQDPSFAGNFVDAPLETPLKKLGKEQDLQLETLLRQKRINQHYQTPETVQDAYNTVLSVYKELIFPAQRELLTEGQDTDLKLLKDANSAPYPWVVHDVLLSMSEKDRKYALASLESSVSEFDSKNENLVAELNDLVNNKDGMKLLVKRGREPKHAQIMADLQASLSDEQKSQINATLAGLAKANIPDANAPQKGGKLRNPVAGFGLGKVTSFTKAVAKGLKERWPLIAITASAGAAARIAVAAGFAGTAVATLGIGGVAAGVMVGGAWLGTATSIANTKYDDLRKANSNMSKFNAAARATGTGFLAAFNVFTKNGAIPSMISSVVKIGGVYSQANNIVREHENQNGKLGFIKGSLARLSVMNAINEKATKVAFAMVTGALGAGAGFGITHAGFSIADYFSGSTTDAPEDLVRPVTDGANPPATGANPPVTGANPPVTGANPPVTGANPPVTGANPPVTGANPPVTGANPPVTGANPPVTGANPPVTGANPPVTGANPPVTGANPPVTGANPPATGNPRPGAGQPPRVRPAVPPAASQPPQGPYSGVTIDRNGNYVGPDGKTLGPNEIALTPEMEAARMRAAQEASRGTRTPLDPPADRQAPAGTVAQRGPADIARQTMPSPNPTSEINNVTGEVRELPPIASSAASPTASGTIRMPDGTMAAGISARTGILMDVQRVLGENARGTVTAAIENPNDANASRVINALIQERLRAGNLPAADRSVLTEALRDFAPQRPAVPVRRP